MTLAVRALRLLALAVWVGGLVFFIVVAGVAFKTMPDAHSAGTIVRGSLLALHRIGLFAGTLYLFLTLGLLALEDVHRVRFVELALVAVMLGTTLYLQQSVLPHMETDRLTLGGDVQSAPADAPARVRFNRLHELSVRLEGLVLIAGAALLCLAPIHGDATTAVVREDSPEEQEAPEAHSTGSLAR